jgi:hypothetical protein
MISCKVTVAFDLCAENFVKGIIGASVDMMTRPVSACGRSLVESVHCKRTCYPLPV